MPNYVLEGPRWGTGVMGTGGGTVTWAVDASIPAAFVAVINSAFSAWANVANIAFQQVSLTTDADIDFTLGTIDGLGNTLGYANYGFFGQQMMAAVVTFDVAEGWHSTGSKVVSSKDIDLYTTVLHEIGHSLGLDHYDGDREIMNSILTPSVKELMLGDITGIQALYGSAPALDDTAAKIARLYFGILDRAPDSGGIRSWIDAYKQGVSMAGIAGGFLGSEEYERHSTGLTDSQFVDIMYAHVLGRTGDIGGVQAWNDYLRTGASRNDVAFGFAGSVEFQSKHATENNQAYVEDLYELILGRSGESRGVQAWSQLLDSHAITRTEAARGFANSQEFLQKYVAPSDAAFVDALYVDALGRHAEAGGLQAWTSALLHGTSRADVALGITQSAEAQAHVVGSLNQGWHFV